ncbi:MAG TPA: acyl-CoA dehydrogenase family protein [Acidimicrobiales bacterium]|nr:MAG: hypothetical protein B7Z69_07725 [Actinobacteria bacterium 21-73-9]HQU27215.1 acyl-CoA dehydrogenase family protein [Acidimicrobiales bacterium]
MESAPTNPGRLDLARWLDEATVGWSRAHPSLARHLETRLGEPLPASWVGELDGFATTVATVIDPAVARCESHRELPRHVPYDGVGRRIEHVEFHPAHAEAASAAWAAGLLDTDLSLEGDLRLAGLFFLLAHVGEGGVACPIVCTIGLRRALERRADPALAERYVASLREVDSARAARGAQFLTEVQGGSDVGANVVVAVPDPEVPGAWRVSGEKWFCSVADADLFALTARPDGAPAGTRGLGCFLVPRTLDGVTPNGFTIRRLKDKLGTRALASAEIDFDDALAFPIGEVDDGFAVAVEELLNVSRWLNALGAAGIMGRAWLVASSFAARRRAFGRSIGAFDGVAEQLALLRVHTDAAIASTMALSALVGRLDEGTASDDEACAHRFLVNALKVVTSLDATACVHDAIEVLGGNGTIEDFSVLPRLYRDAVVFESWEGTHHVLCAQIQRDAARGLLTEGLERWLERELEGAPDGARPLAVRVHEAAHESIARLAPGRVEMLSGSAARRVVTRVTRCVQAATMLRAAGDDTAGAPATASAELFVARHLADGGPSPDWRALVAAVLGPLG